MPARRTESSIAISSRSDLTSRKTKLIGICNGFPSEQPGTLNKKYFFKGLELKHKLRLCCVSPLSFSKVFFLAAWSNLETVALPQAQTCVRLPPPRTHGILKRKRCTSQLVVVKESFHTAFVRIQTRLMLPSLAVHSASLCSGRAATQRS